MTTTVRRGQLAEFLKSCRARITPADVGLPASGRRRTPGLRREDVAALAGLSATWYTWLEQGRDVRASDRILEALSRTLRLSVEERDYLFALAQHRPAPLLATSSPELNPAVRRTLDALRIPALVITPRWDVVYWNRMSTLTFRDYADLPPDGRNLIKVLLTNPVFQENPDDFEVMARRILAKLRVDYSQAAGDPQFDVLIDELTELSPAFRRLWPSPEIVGHSEGVHVFIHPRVGGITLEHTSYVVEGAPALRVVLFAPNDPESAVKMERLAYDTQARAVA